MHAQRLTDVHGLDGFTMDDLAEAAEVSRRTLFNYFTGKVDAVLGRWPSITDDDARAFVAGGPDGDLLPDLRTLLMPLLADRVADRTFFARFRRIVLGEPRLLAGLQGRYERLCGELAGHVSVREGPHFGTDRAKVAVALLTSIFDTALDGFLADAEQRPFVHHFDHTLATARALLA